MSKICKDGEHQPFINPAKGGNPCKMVDEDGLLGKKNKVYYECACCNAFFDPKTGKTAKWKKNAKKAKGHSNGMWWM